MNNSARAQARNFKHDRGSTCKKRKTVRDGIACDTQAKTVQERGKRGQGARRVKTEKQAKQGGWEGHRTEGRE